MTGTHERFQSLFDIRHDHQVVDNGIGRFSGNDPGFGDSEVLAVPNTLLGMADGSALHRPFHGTGSTAGTDVQAPQSQLVTDLLGVIVFLAGDGMTAPADNLVGIHPRAQNRRIAQYMEHGIGDAVRGIHIKCWVIINFVTDVDNITQNGKQVFVDTLDNLAVDERAGRSPRDPQLDTTLFLDHPDVERLVAFQQFLAIIQVTAAVEYRERTVAKQPVQAALAGIEELVDLHLGQYVQATGFR